MVYQITKSQREKAKKLGVTITTSTNTKKKIDVKTPDGIISIGATGYKDYEIYKKTEGKEVADMRRKAYRARHKDDMNVKKRDGKLTAGYLANKILW